MSGVDRLDLSEHRPEDDDGSEGDWQPFDSRRWSREELLAEIDALNATVAKYVGLLAERKRGAVSAERTYEVWVCKTCGTQGDPDGHWGCEHTRWSGANMERIEVVPAPARGAVGETLRESAAAWHTAKHRDALDEERQYDAQGRPLCFECGLTQSEHPGGIECQRASPRGATGWRMADVTIEASIEYEDRYARARLGTWGAEVERNGVGYGVRFVSLPRAIWHVLTVRRPDEYGVRLVKEERREP
jgi:hypothetical protein